MRKIIIISIVLLTPLGVFGNEVTIQPGPEIGQDTYGAQVYPDENYGDLEWMSAGITVFSFLRFTQLDEYIGYEITSATLRIWVFMASDGTRYFYRVLGPWDEDTLTWNNQPSHSSTEYVYYHFPEVDFASDFNIDVTWMVQEWLNGDWDNFGWCIRDYGFLISFATSNSTDPGARPSLILEGPDLPEVGVQPTSLGKIKSLFTPQLEYSGGGGRIGRPAPHRSWMMGLRG